MTIHHSVRLGLLSSTAAGVLAAAILAGAPAAALAQPAGADSAAVGEIVVTATRREESLNRVPISISAQTQATLDTQGIRDMRDLARTTPALTYRAVSNQGFGSAAGTPTLRGVYSGAGAQTVGVYLDDVPLQRRVGQGLAGNGTPIPQLFDLERVEVLRGPQGTLYGGSSEGGAIRFITPTPSLTRYSAYARAEGSETKDGAASGEIGLAIGGPIIQDKLGFRVSGSAARIGGWVDRVQANNGRLVDDDANWKTRSYVRAALRWQPTQELSITPAIYVSKAHSNDDDHWWRDVPAYTLPSQTFFANGQLGGPPPTYTRPAQNYPATTWFGPYKNGDQDTSPRTDVLNIYSLNVQYDLGFADFMSLTALDMDTVKGNQFQLFDLIPLTPVWGGYYSADPTFSNDFPYRTHRRSFTQEFRLTSKGDSRLTWVLGGFYQNGNSDVTGFGYENFDAAILPSLRGVRSAQFYGIDEASIGYIHLGTTKKLGELSLAGFADATYAITDALKITAGIRATKDTFKFDTCAFGVELGVRNCTVASGTLINGRQSSSPVLPKLGLSYQINPTQMVYASMARGFRNGGVNQPVPRNTNCQFGLTQVGGSRPDTFEPDYVWSYEAGGKFRLLDGKAQINASAFRVDWKDVQQSINLPRCPFDYIDNAGKARSQGFDVQATLRPTTGLSIDVAVAYTDAKYTETVTRGPAPTIFVRNGDKLPVSPWTFSIGAEYSFPVSSRIMAYVRGDYDYQSGFKRTPGPGAFTYAPDIYDAASADIANFRVGMRLDKADISLFVKNAFNSQDELLEFGGRTGCLSLDCSTFQANNLTRQITSYRPREIGLTATYRY